MKISFLLLSLLLDFSLCNQKNDNFFEIEPNKSYQFFIGDNQNIIKLIYDDDKTELLIFNPGKKNIGKAEIIFPYKFEIASYTDNLIKVRFNSFSQEQEAIISKFNPKENVVFSKTVDVNLESTIRNFHGSSVIPSKVVDSLSFITRKQGVLLFNGGKILDTISASSLHISSNEILESFERDKILISKLYQYGSIEKFLRFYFFTKD